MPDALLQVGVNDAKFVSRALTRGMSGRPPDAERAGGLDAMLVPGSWAEHEVVGARVMVVAIDDRIGALALHDEAQRRRRMMGRGDLAGFITCSPEYSQLTAAETSRRPGLLR